jgi:hypothetical protein
MPRERFCALAQGAATLISAAADGRQSSAPVKLSAMDGASALLAEACP